MEDILLVTVRTQDGSNQFQQQIALSHDELDKMVYPAGAVVATVLDAINRCRRCVGRGDIIL